MTPEERQTQHFEVVVLGAGLSGVCAAIKLKEAGIENVRVFEKASDVGGTWRDNRYPGVAWRCELGLDDFDVIRESPQGR
ncbi:NAD(P)-binding protein [Ilumatobacter sp.]|uniref:NAD(P)-binding protein n=1 Tax=Ilumatobacter sp. TaxID=1967498 RepID=UPI003C5B678C